MDNQETIHIWTDGACIGNPGPGGWAYVKKLGDKTATKSGYVCSRTTNIAMEMTAVIQALRSLKRTDLATVVHTDLKMIVQGMTEWMPGWIARDWRNNQREPVANRELWEELNSLVAQREPGARITFEWVKGHAGVLENEQADRLAEAAAREAAKKPGAALMPSRFDPETGLIVPIFAAAEA